MRYAKENAIEMLSLSDIMINAQISDISIDLEKDPKMK